MSSGIFQALDLGCHEGDGYLEGAFAVSIPSLASTSQLLTLYLGWDPIAMATRAYWLIGLL